MPQASVRSKLLKDLHKSAIAVAIHWNEDISAILNSSSDSESELTDDDDWMDVSSDDNDTDSPMILSSISTDSSVLSVALGVMSIDSSSESNDTMSVAEEMAEGIDSVYRDMLNSIEALEDEVMMACILEHLGEEIM